MGATYSKKSVNWSVRQGSSLVRLLRIRQDGQPLSLVGQTIKFALTDRRGIVVKELTEADGDLVVNLEQGEILVKIKATTTEDLAPTTYGILLDITAEADLPLRYLEGELSVSQGVRL